MLNMIEYVTRCKLMGTAFELCVVAFDQKEADHYLQIGINEIKRVESLLSTFRQDSVTTRINDLAGIAAVKVTDEVYNLIERCVDISIMTHGYFDITVGPLKDLYRFENTQFEFPPKHKIEETLTRVGYNKIELSAADHTVYLEEPGMSISFAAIGKGYAADCVKRAWLNECVVGGYINASGDLTAFGLRANDQRWGVGIADPKDRSKVLFYTQMEFVGAVATSGDYEQFFIHDGKRFSHNINPKTGLPLQGLQSVSVFCHSAELADALATAIYAMGKTEGIGFVDQLPLTHCIIIDENHQPFFSKGLHLRYAN